MLSPEQIDILFPDIWEEDYILPKVDMDDFTRAYPDYEQTPIWDSMANDPGRMGEVAAELEEEFNVPDFSL